MTDRQGQTQEWTEPITGMQFVWVPEGCYYMGCGPWTTDCNEDEKPVHEVCLDGFWLGKYQVTQGQWKKIMYDNPAFFQEGDDYPVEMVSWDDCHKFIRKLSVSNQEKFGFRLPTEAQWEYAARSGGQNEIYAGGSELPKLAWYQDNSEGRTKPVGSKNPNGLGLYDMSGNVWEWVQDIYRKDAYSLHEKHNPVITSGGQRRVFRGGSWYNEAIFLRCSFRSFFAPLSRVYYLGFRLACSA
ncbi:MAG: formylglycine-generating enzyme family protein [Desulfohalobiaceae bacterium]